VSRSDEAAVVEGGVPLLVGAGAVAEAFTGRAQAAESALLDGVSGAVVASAGRLLLVLEVSVEDGRIVEIDVVASLERLAAPSLLPHRRLNRENVPHEDSPEFRCDRPRPPGRAGHLLSGIWEIPLGSNADEG